MYARRKLGDNLWAIYENNEIKVKSETLENILVDENLKEKIHSFVSDLLFLINYSGYGGIH